MDLNIEFELEDDGRWIAEIPELAGVLAYGTTPEEAKASVEALALRVIAASDDEFTWQFRNAEEVGPKVLARIARKTGLTPQDL